MDLEVTVAILDLNGLLIKVERIDKLQLRKIITGVFNIQWMDKSRRFLQLSLLTN